MSSFHPEWEELREDLEDHSGPGEASDEEEEALEEEAGAASLEVDPSCELKVGATGTRVSTGVHTCMR